MGERVKRKWLWLDGLRSVLSSDYFPIFTAVVSLVSYYIGADLINIYIFGAVMIAMILLLDDLTPLFTHMLFLAVICSKTNSPMYGVSGFYTVTSNFVQIGCIIGLIVIAAVYRFIRQAQAKKVHLSLVFISVIVLAAVYVLNGVFSSEHASDDLIYGVILAASLLPLYALMSCTVQVNESTIKKICTGCLIFSCVLVAEVFVVMLQADLSSETISLNAIRDNMRFGWGMWNNAGMLLVICIAPVMYLSLKNRGGAFYVIWAAVICVAVICTTSRQSYLGAFIAYCISGIYVFVKSRGRKSNRIALAVVVAAALVFLVLLACYCGEEILAMFKTGLFNSDGEYTASGRIRLIQMAWENFLSSPVFGVGFYADNTTQVYVTAMTWFPHFYHNTIAQMLGSCGIAGIAAYLFHRVVTVIAFFKTRAMGKWFLGISMLAYLVMSMFDNHMFYILSGFIYPAFIVVLTNPVHKENAEPTAAEKEDKPEAYSVGSDVFLDGLTEDERSEFFALFITEGEARITRVKTYVIGGDNSEFFSDCFLYLGAVSGASDSLMDKIYIAAQNSGGNIENKI